MKGCPATFYVLKKHKWLNMEGWERGLVAGNLFYLDLGEFFSSRRVCCIRAVLSVTIAEVIVSRELKLRHILSNLSVPA